MAALSSTLRADQGPCYFNSPVRDGKDDPPKAVGRPGAIVRHNFLLVPY
jgi:hypothetical protein